MNWVSVVQLVLDGVVTGVITLEKARALNAEIKQMQAEGRDPTPEEFAAQYLHSTELDQQLDAVDKRLNP